MIVFGNLNGLHLNYLIIPCPIATGRGSPDCRTHSRFAVNTPASTLNYILDPIVFETFRQINLHIIHYTDALRLKEMIEGE